MITADRFLAAKHIDEAAWLAARRAGATATAVAEVAAKRDRAAGINDWLNPVPFNGNVYTDWGNLMEPELMRFAHDTAGILPSDWVIAGDDRGHRATPDGLSLDHMAIAEGKTTGDPWAGAESKLSAIPIKYRRQVQWQLHVTGAERCLFVWMWRRVDEDGFFIPGWPWPKSIWINRDDFMIRGLVEVADDMLAALERSAA